MGIAYLDTCVVSGIAKEDLPSAELDALLSILKAGREGRIKVVTSGVTATEIANVPEQYRRKHEMIFNLLSQVPPATRYSTDSGLSLMGVGGGRREDPLATALKGVLDDGGDVDHLFQAAKNGAVYFVTTDDKTILRRAHKVKEICGVSAVRPTELAAEMSS